MMLKPNQYGMFKKSEILKAGYEILDYGLTATEIKNTLGVNLAMDQRLKYCIGFTSRKGMRGYVPVFEPNQIIEKVQKGELFSTKF